MNASQNEDLTFDRSFIGAPGELEQVSPLVRRMVAGNSGPMTFTGTCTYVVGTGRIAIIDPGPDRPEHFRALLDALAGETVETILVTHTHRDHSPGARALKGATGAPIAGCARYAAPVGRSDGSFIRIDAANDQEHAPDLVMREGDAIEIGDFSLVCVETPGHSANHLAFALPQEKALFSGDHVMAWATSVVVPPDGTMSDYMASLEKLRARDDRIYWPGHGGPVVNPQAFVRALAQHRRGREKSILASVRGGNSTIEAIVKNVYEGLDPALRGAAGLSVFAHLEDLISRGLVRVEGPALLTAAFHPARSP
ncbi:MBL fold metallo-hydrolase [Methylocapsa palsarum]|uniref:Glyoxylase, beta-lactamase superfamily II n=1 Tax=Methylocapsa palsarum TaxID=1612308 RepID=A0A1I4B0N8_9HYPH|nr:MBL fold metallo-hydrolase [Methylocapsa palsarum]SFK62335.1 Glyoxylase, beta-lactamase superfamily II [Methylocapsa palsarum]